MSDGSGCTRDGFSELPIPAMTSVRSQSFWSRNRVIETNLAVRAPGSKANHPGEAREDAA